MTDGGEQPQGREPRERLLAETPVTAVGRGSRSPLVITLLVLAAFAAGLLRPWDLVSPSPELSQPPATGAAVGSPSAPAQPTITAELTPEPGSALALCGHPSSWRTMSRVWWSGRPATTWTAADVVDANGPSDPAIPFTRVGPAPVTAIGWCAPVGDSERPPSDAVATLFLVGHGGEPAVQGSYSLLTPPAGTGIADIMGQLWGTAGPRAAPWPAGRYVIRFATPSYSWVRYLGLDVEGPTASPSPGGTPTY